ncbi:uncharacterized protein LOC114958808 [Acropora millepora]|uniref:uncharacterized protein LOC114958808 n=1 Tax=Acropora millepora TaxID=45264 RepID=UPI001CF1E6B7|nr:uncharacterized protein LOC114958808 [Acropora millepora]
MIEELLRRFARENFNGDYVPLLHGQSKITNPLSLMIKQKRPMWKIPFARDEFTILAGLEKYVSSDSENSYREAVSSKIIKEQKMEKGRDDPVNSDRSIDVNVPDVGEVKLTAADHLGVLLLGKLREEYIKDPDLRGILSDTVLDAEKMTPYQDQELFLITSVVYSEKFEVVGERKQELEVKARVQPLEWYLVNLISKLFFKFKEVYTPSGAARRNESAPILFKYCRVQYKEEAKKLEIMEGEFIGSNVLTRNIELPKDLKIEGDASSDDDDDGEHIDNDDVENDDGQVPDVVVADDIIPVLDDFTDQDKKNIERIYNNVLMTTSSREEQKTMVKKYLGWLTDLLADDKMKIVLDKPLTSNDCPFLRSFYVAALPGQDTLDFTKVKKAEIHGCGFILKLFDELSDEEWEELGIQSS